MKKRNIVAVMLIFTFLIPVYKATAKVSAGSAYGANIFTGLLVGGLLGAASGLVPYSEDKCQNPEKIAYSAVYGSIGTALILGTPLGAYEVGSNKKGAGTSIMFSSLGFGVLGAAAGAGYSMVEYQKRFGTEAENNGEIILRDAAYGAVTGAVLGTLIGMYEVMVWREPDGLLRPPGSGIHARLGVFELSTVLKGPIQARYLPNVKLAEIKF